MHWYWMIIMKKYLDLVGQFSEINHTLKEFFWSDMTSFNIGSDVAWWHQAITWTNVDPMLVRFIDNHLSNVSHQSLKSSWKLMI